jgi:hypothetical protein
MTLWCCGLLCVMVRSFQCCHVELDHLHHRFHHSLYFLSVRVADELHESSRHNLPRETELIGDPATLQGGSAGASELVPVLVNFFLVLAVDKERETLGECERRWRPQSSESWWCRTSWPGKRWLGGSQSAALGLHREEGCSIITCAQYVPLAITYGTVWRKVSGTSLMSGKPTSRAVRNGKCTDSQQRPSPVTEFVAAS